MKLPARFMPHTVTVKPFTGRSSTGPVYGVPFSLACMAQGGVRMVRGPDGQERTSQLTLYAGLEAFDLVPAGSVVTHNGDDTTVIVCIPHDDGGMGTPQHAEVVCE